MKHQNSAGSTKRIWIVVAVLSALVLLFPIGFTTAYLTDKVTASKTSGGTGRWCSVPNPKQHPNVYRLKEFPRYSDAKEGTENPFSANPGFIIVPVVNTNGEFAPTDGSGAGTAGSRDLSVRLWSCDATSQSTNSSIKVTGWRATGSATPYWLSEKSAGFAGQRLDPTRGFGLELAKLHVRGTSRLTGGLQHLTGSDRQLYTWILSSNRTKTDLSADPDCLTHLCVINIKEVPSFQQAFKNDTGGAGAPSNSVEYSGQSYWNDSGDLSPNNPRNVRMTSYSGARRPPFAQGQRPTSTDGRQVQWVVMEWWGSTAPSDDMVAEVVLR